MDTRSYAIRTPVCRAWWVSLLLLNPRANRVARAQEPSAPSLPAPGAEPDSIAQEYTDGHNLENLTALELTSLCFEEDSAPEPWLAKIDDASGDVDTSTLAKFALSASFLSPTELANTTSAVSIPLREEVLACAPDPEAAQSSVEVLAACHTVEARDDGSSQYLILWSVTFTCTNEISVIQGSQLDAKIGTVLCVAPDTPIAIEKLWLS